MRIGINASFLRKPGTGIGQVTFNFLEKLKEFPISNFQFPNRENIEFFLYCEEEPNLPFLLPENFEVKHFLPRWWKRDDVPRKWLWERQLAKEAVKDGCDAFLSLYQSSTRFQNSPNLRHVMVVHDIIPRFFPEYQRTFMRAWYFKQVEKGIAKADHIVTISEHTKKDMIRELHIPESNISVASPDAAPRFHTIATPEAVGAILKKYNLSPGYIYHGGGLEIRKNAERLLRAYAALVHKSTRSLDYARDDKLLPCLVISGKIFDTKNKLATDVAGLIRELKLEEKVKLLGFVPDEDLPALYRGALFFVYPSLYEGFGLPVLEALYQGVPVLAANNSSLPEVGGEAALYVDPTDTEAIAAQMEYLLTDETLRTTLISHSAAQVAKFHWDIFVEKIIIALKQ